MYMVWLQLEWSFRFRVQKHTHGAGVSTSARAGKVYLLSRLHKILIYVYTRWSKYISVYHLYTANIYVYKKNLCEMRNLLQFSAHISLSQQQRRRGGGINNNNKYQTTKHFAIYLCVEKLTAYMFRYCYAINKHKHKFLCTCSAVYSHILYVDIFEGYTNILYTHMKKVMYGKQMHWISKLIRANRNN